MQMRKMTVVLVVMSVVSLVLLFLLSFFTYIFKWKADTALAGITLIYIVVGYTGGKVKSAMSDEMRIGRKILDGIVAGNLFMAILLAVSCFLIGNEIYLESRLFMIWMLIIGSAALGRIL